MEKYYFSLKDIKVYTKKDVMKVYNQQKYRKRKRAKGS